MGTRSRDTMSDSDGGELKVKKQSSVTGMSTSVKRFLNIGTSDKDSKAAASKRKVTRTVKNIEDDNSEHSEFEVVQHPERAAEERKMSMAASGKKKGVSNK